MICLFDTDVLFSNKYCGPNWNWGITLHTYIAAHIPYSQAGQGRKRLDIRTLCVAGTALITHTHTHTHTHKPANHTGSTLPPAPPHSQPPHTHTYISTRISEHVSGGLQRSYSSDSKLSYTYTNTTHNTSAHACTHGYLNIDIIIYYWSFEFSIHVYMDIREPYVWMYLWHDTCVHTNTMHACTQPHTHTLPPTYTLSHTNHTHTRRPKGVIQIKYDQRWQHRWVGQQVACKSRFAAAHAEPGHFARLSEFSQSHSSSDVLDSGGDHKLRTTNPDEKNSRGHTDPAPPRWFYYLLQSPRSPTALLGAAPRAATRYRRSKLLQQRKGGTRDDDCCQHQDLEHNHRSPDGVLKNSSTSSLVSPRDSLEDTVNLE